MSDKTTVRGSTQTYELNSALTGYECLRCHQAFAVDDEIIDLGTGCPKCLEQGFPVSLMCTYKKQESLSNGSRTRMLRFAPHLPYKNFPILGEGDTPLVPLAKLGNKLGVNQLWFKNEGQNPTGSHKDRMSGLAVARAKALGKSAVIAASSGNAGASLAAYAAAIDLSCVIVSMSSISPMWEAAIEFHGAQLHARQGQDDRWKYMQQMVTEHDMYPVTNFLKPPVGSNPFGIEGYKTIAFELVEELGNIAPLVVLIPTCRGDLLAGMLYGFLDAKNCGLIDRLPRLVAVEPGARLELVLQGEDYREEFPVPSHHLSSIGAETVSYQSYNALNITQGTAVGVGTRQCAAAQKTLGTAGLYVELSSAAALAGAEVLASKNYFTSDDNVVLLGTSHGYKELPQKYAWTI
ncbi:MAG: pyridoxal-phosphate dependent enzyme [Candidatus Melainabacteria bacterium]|nr:pyridoxal-phosphate dependent enzyme [Candidatus Melainabacteria bacterium]